MCLLKTLLVSPGYKYYYGDYDPAASEEQNKDLRWFLLALASSVVEVFAGPQKFMPELQETLKRTTLNRKPHPSII